MAFAQDFKAFYQSTGPETVVSIAQAEALVIDPFLLATGMPADRLPAAHAWGQAAVHHMALAETVFG